MRKLADLDRIRRFMRAVGRAAPVETRLYFTGGATAVLLGWRSTTVDVDIRFFPETDQVFRAVPRLKEDLEINVELASPADFIPELPGWRERSLFADREGRMSFYHYDPYSQALAKIERRHSQDLMGRRSAGSRRVDRAGDSDASFCRNRVQAQSISGDRSEIISASSGTSCRLPATRWCRDRN